jgi:uncharacterized protein YxjI
MGDNAIYVVDNGDDGIEIMEDGFITHENINKMKFTFTPGQDITESLNKKVLRVSKTYLSPRMVRLDTALLLVLILTASILLAKLCLLTVLYNIG